MILARVLGNIVALKKPALRKRERDALSAGIPEGGRDCDDVLALNAVDAGVGDTVLIVQRVGAHQPQPQVKPARQLIQR